MAYGLKYQSQFTNVTDANNPAILYTLQFLFKDYSGGVISVSGADTSVVQSCATDDPLAPIKGQSLAIKLVNAGNIPITNFYAENDTDIQVKLLAGTDVRFIGFLVQDDCSEEKVDYEHVINLSATDSLGLLKGVVLSESRVKRKYNAVVRTNGPLDEILISIDNPDFYAAVGDTLELFGVEYTITNVSDVPIVLSLQNYNFTLTIATPVAALIAPIDTPFFITGALDLLRRNAVLSLISACISATKLPLITNIFCNVFEYRQANTSCTLSQTWIDSQTFISGETYQDCYTVLERLMKTWECSIFQSNGEWNIMHWFEVRKYPANAIPGFVYDETFTLLGATVFNNTFTIGVNGVGTEQTVITYPCVESILRPFKFVRKQYDYVTPKYLWKNYDLHELGDLITTYINGDGNTVNEYFAIGFQGSSGGTRPDRFIRIITDTILNVEISRQLIVKGGGTQPTGVLGTPFDVGAGDKLKVTFSFKTGVSQAGSINLVFSVNLYNGTDNRYVLHTPPGNGDWSPTLGFSYNIPSGENSDQWHTVEIQSSQIPFDGRVTIALRQAVFSPGTTEETIYKDMRLDYIPFINDSTKIIGQIHKQNRTPDIKNNLDENIFIDDSPRNSIVGTLFLDTYTGLNQDRTRLWIYDGDLNAFRLGEMTSREIQIYRDKMRSKLEGGFIGIQQTLPVSLLTAVNVTFNPNNLYIFGLLTIDYKRNQFNGTLWEIYNTTEPELSATYTFNYIYDSK